MSQDYKRFKESKPHDDLIRDACQYYSNTNRALSLTLDPIRGRNATNARQCPKVDAEAAKTAVAIYDKIFSSIPSAAISKMNDIAHEPKVFMKQVMNALKKYMIIGHLNEFIEKIVMDLQLWIVAEDADLNNPRLQGTDFYKLFAESKIIFSCSYTEDYSLTHDIDRMRPVMAINFCNIQNMIDMDSFDYHVTMKDHYLPDVIFKKYNKKAILIVLAAIQSLYRLMLKDIYKEYYENDRGLNILQYELFGFEYIGND